MIRGVRCINSYGDNILMRTDFFYNEQGPFSLFSIDGLSQGVADIHATELATMDGSVVNGARQASRELTLTVLFNDTANMFYADGPYRGSFNIQNARDKLNRYFPLKDQIKVGIIIDDPYLGQYSSNPVACYMCEAIVKEVQADIFAKQCAGRVTLHMLSTKFDYVEDDTNGIPTATTEYTSESPLNAFTATILNEIGLLRFINYAQRANFVFSVSDSKWRYIETGELYSKEELLAFANLSISQAIYDANSKIHINVSPYFSNSSYDALTPAYHYADYSALSTIDSVPLNETAFGYSDRELLYYDIIIPLTTSISASDLSDGVNLFFGNNYRGGSPASVSVTNPYIMLRLVNLLSYSEFKTRGLVSGDIITISSDPGKRDVGIRLSGTTTDISVNGILSQRSIFETDWPYILPKTPSAYACMQRSASYQSIKSNIATGAYPNSFRIVYKQSKRGL